MTERKKLESDKNEVSCVLNNELYRVKAFESIFNIISQVLFHRKGENHAVIRPSVLETSNKNEKRKRTMSGTKGVATSAALLAGGAYLLHKTLPSIVTTMAKIQLNPLDEEVGKLIQEKGAPSYEEIKAFDNIAGKSALVVGGTRGVGYGTALALAMSGASIVTLVGRSEESGSNAVSKIISELGGDSTPSTTINFVQGDIGTVASTNKLVEKLQKGGVRYDYLIVSAAIFPQRKDPSPLNADGIEKSFGIAVVGRFLLYHKAHSFMKMASSNDASHSPMILNVLASGTKLGMPFDRGLVRSLHSFHLLNIANFALGNEIALHKLTKGGTNSDGTPFVIPIVTTHPGLLKTDLHRGQGLWMDVIESIGVYFMGSTEEECGRRQVSIMNAVGEKRQAKMTSSLLTIVDNFGYGRRMNSGMEKDIAENGNWLWNLLLLLENGGNVKDYKD